MDFQFSRSLRIISVVVLAFFIWTFGGIFDIVDAVNTKRSLSQTVFGSGMQMLAGSPNKITANPDKNPSNPTSDTDTKKAEARAKKAEIENLDVEINRQFSDTEKKLKNAGLPPQILDRHHRFVQHYKDNLQKLRDEFDNVERTGSGADTWTKKVKEFLKGIQPSIRQDGFDREKGLGHKQAEPVFKEPRTRPEEFEIDSQQDSRQSIVDSQEDSRQHVVGSRQGKTTQPMLLASNGPLTGLLPQESMVRQAHHDTVTLSLSKGGYPTKTLGYDGIDSLSRPDSQLLIADASAAPYTLLAQVTSSSTPADLKETTDIKFTARIRNKAGELGYDPLKIYNWVRNNIVYEPSYGSIQGADMCLQTMRCNDTDTASLLIALMRVSNVDARYVYGTIELPTDKVLNWLGGLSDAYNALNLLASAGIPVRPVISGGKIDKIQIEHTWAEAWINYIPFRGADHKTGHGDTWIPLDASFKQYGTSDGIDLGTAVPFDVQTFINQIVGSSTISESGSYATNVKCDSVSQYSDGFHADMQNYLTQTNPPITISEVLGGRNIIAQDFPYLLGTLPYKTIVRGATYNELPGSLRHSLTFTLTNNDYYSDSYGEETINITKSLPELAGKRITLSYSPATPDDEAVINSYMPKPHADGSALSLNEYPTTLPAYLIQVKAELRVDGTVIATGTSGVGLGGYERLSMSLYYPKRPGADQDLMVKSGEYVGIALALGGISSDQLAEAQADIENTKTRLQTTDLTGLTKDDIMGSLLYASAVAYLAEADIINSIRAKTMGVVSVRLPSQTAVSSMLTTTYIFGIPKGVSSAGLSGAQSSYLKTVASKDGNPDKTKQYMLLSGLDASAMETILPEYLYTATGSSVTALSVAKALRKSSEQGMSVYRITQGNSSSIVSQLGASTDVKNDITNSASAGMDIIAPKTSLTVGGWSGYGYMTLDPRSGNNSLTLNGTSYIVQGMPWAGRSILMNLTPTTALPPRELSSSIINESFIAGFEGISTGIADFPSSRAGDHTDLFTSSHLFNKLADSLSCYLNLSNSTSTGNCMAAFLGLSCVSLNTPPISEKNTRPVADAGVSQSVLMGTNVTFDGSRSYDPDRDPITYQWKLVSVPQGSTAKLSNAASVNPTFTADLAGTYIAELKVNDGKATSDPVRVTITATPQIVEVPSLIGMTRTEAEAALFASGLSLGQVTASADQTVPSGKTVSQNPPAGTHANRGTAINLVISTGVQADTEPPVITLTFDRDPSLYTAGDPVRLTINTSDATGIAAITLTVDGNPVTYTSPTTVIGTTGYTPGSVHTVIVTATDISSNTSTASTTFAVLDPNDTTYPAASITSPGPDSQITAPTDIIGTASDTNLIEYTLAYSEVGKNQYTIFARGTSSVTNGTLGRLDPTLMKNGLYDILLTAVDANGNTTYYPLVYRISGDLKVGNFTVSFTDLNIPVAGIPITVTRTYDSRDKTMRDFGYGWNVDIQNVKIEKNVVPGQGWSQTSSGSGGFHNYCVGANGERYVSITLPDGKVEEFDSVPVPQCQQFVPIDYVTFSYTARPGTTSTLTAKNTGPFPLYYGTFLDPDTLEPYNPTEYTLTTADGSVYELDQSFGIRKVSDTNGNTLTYSSSGIIHSTGKSVSFTRDSKGRIATISDPMGNTINYAYDSSGNLSTVTDQIGNVTQYTYNSTHGLIDVIDPLGRRAVRNEYDSSGRLTAHIDAEGNRIEYTHNINGREEIVKDRNGNITLFVYDDKGRVIGKTDPLGNLTSYTYDANGNKLTETDPLGNTTTWTYDSKNNKLSETKTLKRDQGTNQTVATGWTYNNLGKVLTTTDPLGHVTTNTYDTKGNLLTTTDPLGNVTTNTYDAKGNLLSVKDALGNLTSYEYDYHGNRTKHTDALGNITTYTYDTNGNKLTETDPRGNITRYSYDKNGKVLTTTNPEGAVTLYEYDATGNKTTETNPLGFTTRFHYDSANRLVSTEYPDGTTTKTVYDNEGNRIASIDQGDRTTSYEYNASKQLIKTTYPDQTTREFGYDATGRQITVSDALGNTTTKEYDSLGRVTGNIDPEGNVTSFEYDLNGNQTKQTDANGHSTIFAYDAINRLITTTLPGGQATTIEYDAIGRKVSETDAAGNKTQFGYDAKGNLISVTDALNGITKYEYDANNNRTAIVDARGNRTTFGYDSLNRMTSKTMPNGGVETYAYDTAGRQAAKTDAKGQTTQFGYDSNGRLLSKTYPDASAIQFAYTSTGKRLTATDKRGMTNYTYDNRDRLATVTNPDNLAINYTYDPNGRIGTISSLAGTISYIYTSGGRLKEVHDPQGNVTSYSYDLAGNRTGLAYPNGINVSYSYDINNRLTNLMHKNSVAAVLASYSYTLGAIGNRTRIDEANGISRVYEYDKLYRLTEETVTDPANIQTYQNDYTYDAAGNRLNKTNTPFSQPAVSNDYTYNAADQLVSENGITYTYDLNGNLATKTDSTVTTTYEYDYENRLIKASSSSGIITYQYDADGNRVEQTNGSGTVRYLVDTNRSLAQILAEYTPAIAVIASYVYADDLISMNRGGVVSYYHFDGLGSTRLLTNSLGTVTDTYDYDAFGNLISRTGTTETSFLFTGQQYDANIGFYYLRARYYQPTSGRFTSFDPFDGDPYAPTSLHKYLFAGDDPINKIDPSGEDYTMVGTLSAISFSQALMVIAVPIITTLTLIQPPFRFYRYTSTRKISQAISTGFVTGDLGVTWWTPDFYFTAQEAKQYLALPYMPEGWLSVLIYRLRDLLVGPLRVEKSFGEPGGGTQYWTFKPIPFWSRSPQWGFFTIYL